MFFRQSPLSGICPLGEDILPGTIPTSRHRVLPASVAFWEKNCAGASLWRRLREEEGSSGFGVAFFLKKTEAGAERFVSKGKPRLLGRFFMLDQKIINAYYG
jgi:hypothetical protein